MEKTCKDIIDGVCSWDKDGNYWRGHRHSWFWITCFNVVNLIYDLIHGKMKSDAEKQKMPVVLMMVGYLDKQRLWIRMGWQISVNFQRFLCRAMVKMRHRFCFRHRELLPQQDWVGLGQVGPSGGKSFGEDAQEWFKGLGIMSSEKEERYFDTPRGKKISPRYYTLGKFKLDIRW